MFTFCSLRKTTLDKEFTIFTVIEECIEFVVDFQFMEHDILFL